LAGSTGSLEELGKSINAGSMNAGSTVTRMLVLSFGVGGLEDVGAEPEEGGSDEGGLISVIGVSVRCGR
jgi:hypothetical protein